MIISRRAIRIRELGASVTTFALVHAWYRVHIVRNQNVTCDDGLFLPSLPRLGHTSRPVLTAILEGSARIRAGSFERWLEPGDVILVPEKGLVSMRQQGTSFHSVAIEWTPATIGGAAAKPTCGRLNGSLSDFARLAGALTDTDDPPRAASLLAKMLVLLRGFGAPFEAAEPGALIEPIPEAIAKLSRALDATLTRLEDNPMIVDLHALLGVSPRQLQRLVAAFNARYGFNSGGWRDTLNRRRLLVGATMMTAAGARTEGVAHALGYASPTSFCHALDAAGMPSPGEIARRVARLQ